MRGESAVNVACSIGRMTHQEKWPSGLKASHEVSEAEHEDRPDESGKIHVTPSKAPLIRKEGIEHLNHS
jgi:hypothetical protein